MNRSSLRFYLLALSGLITLLNGCNQIETGDTLDAEDAARIRQLFKLDADEHIVKFYSNYKPSVAGSFFTDKRVGSYWLDENDANKTRVSSERFENLVAIDTIYSLPFPSVPYLAVTTKDSVKFRLAVDGEISEKKAFFEEVLDRWKKAKK